MNRKTIWVSFHIETGGPWCGIIQLSAVFYDQDVVLLGQFDQYVKPPQFAVFLPQACECHGINHRDDQRLKGAPQIEVVWNYFCEYVDVIFSTGVKDNCVGILVAWNGKACDMEWIYKLINSNNNCIMPQQIKYFMDPLRVIKKCPGCKLHKKENQSTRSKAFNCI